MKTGDKRFNEEKFQPEIFIIDRWLESEWALDSKMILTQSENEKICKDMFGDQWEEAYDLIYK